jgi:hypothetical protein
MILNKTTTGFIVQKFDSESGRCISQEFVAGDQVVWEDQRGNSIEDGQYGIDLEGFYYPAELKQPE